MREQKLYLKSKYLEIIYNILDKYVSEQIVWAYGSRVKNTAHEGSDLDLVILNSEDLNIPQKNLSQLQQAFIESDLPISIDILDWALIPDSFRNIIKEEYIKIYP